MSHITIRACHSLRSFGRPTAAVIQGNIATLSIFPSDFPLHRLVQKVFDTGRPKASLYCNGSGMMILKLWCQSLNCE